MKCKFFESGVLAPMFRLAAVAMLTLSFGTSAWAVSSLFDFGINVDGTTTCGDFEDPCDTSDVPDLSGVPGVDDTGFDFGTGLGDIVVTIVGLGSHGVNLFLDHDIDIPFFDETGAANGVPAAGQSWEIDEPGFGSSADGSGGIPYFGDIFENLLAGVYDNMVFFDAVDNQILTPPDDVSMGLGFDFTVSAGQTAIITFNVGQVSSGGFELQHTDTTSGEALFFSAVLEIQGRLDNDDDGVSDEDDLCTDSSQGDAVDSAGCSDAQVDIDGDGVCDPGAPSLGPSACGGSDNCPADPNPAQEDFDMDDIGDVCDPDDDGDGVADGTDICSATFIPESVPASNRGLGKNRWMLDNADGSFTQGPPQKGSTLSFTTEDTAGCSCEQIIAELGLGNGHTKYGCSNGAMMDWVNLQN